MHLATLPTKLTTKQIHTSHVLYKYQEIEMCQISTVYDISFMVMLKMFDELLVPERMSSGCLTFANTVQVTARYNALQGTN